MESQFLSKFLAILHNEEENMKGPESFSQILFTNRNYHRLVVYYKEQKQEIKAIPNIKYWYLLSLLKLKRLKEVELFLEEIPEIDFDSRLLYVKGLLCLKQLDFDTAVEKFLQSFKLDPHFIEPLHKLLEHHLLSESSFRVLLPKLTHITQSHQDGLAAYASITWLSSGDIKKYFALAEELLKKNPTSERIITAFVSCCFALEKKKELFVIAQKLLETEPDSYLSSFAAGCHLALMQRGSAARSLLRISITKAPSFAPAWLAYAITYKQDNDPRMALSVVQVAARAFPKFDLLHVWAGHFCTLTNDTSLAIAHFSRCQQTSYVLNEVGCLLTADGRLEEAASAFEKALEVGDDFLELLFNAATTFRRIGRFEQAIQLFKKVLEKDPEHYQAMVGLGFALHLTQSLDEAIEWYMKAFSINQNDNFLNEMLANAANESAASPIIRYVPCDDKFEDLFADYMKNRNIES